MTAPVSTPPIKTGYVVNIPLKVSSDTEADTSSGEEEMTFPKDYFTDPFSHFRMVPALRAPMVESDSENEEAQIQSKSRLIRRGQVSKHNARIPKKDKGMPSRAVQNAYDKVKGLIQQYSKESFDSSAAKSQQVQKERLRVVFGLNKMRSLSYSRNQSLGRAVKKLADCDASFSSFGFFWSGAYQERKHVKDARSWKDCSFERVREFYRQLKKENPKRAVEFRKKLEAARGHLVPYRGLRERLAKSKETAKAVEELRKNTEIQRLYLGIFDDDSLSLHAPDGRGVFSHYDEMIEKKPKLEMGSCGYLFSGHETKKSQEDPVRLASSEMDLRIRHATAQFFAYGVYFPEPSSIVRIPQDAKTISYSFETKEKHYASPQESIIILEQIRKKFQKDPNVVCFNGEGAIPTVIPRRAEKPFSAHYNAYNKIVRWTERDLKRMRGVAQSHLHPKKWADNVIRDLDIEAVELELEGEAIELSELTVRHMVSSLISRIFQHYNVISMAQDRLSEMKKTDPDATFPSQLIDILHNYEPHLAPLKQMTRRKADKNTPQLRMWKCLDQIDTLADLRDHLSRFIGDENSKKIESAAKACGKEVLEIFKKRFETQFDELSLALMRDCLEDLDPGFAEAAHALKPTKAAEMILNSTALNNRETLCSGFSQALKSEVDAEGFENQFLLKPLHWAAVTGNRLIIERLKNLKTTLASFADIHVQSKGGATPLYFALKYCADNGNDLGLIKELLDSVTALPASEDILPPLILTLEELESPAPVVELLFQHNVIDNAHKAPLLTVLKKLHPAQCRESILNSLILHMPQEALSAVQKLIEMGLHVDERGYALTNDDLQYHLKELHLVNTGAISSVYEADPLPLAVRRGDLELVKTLIEHGAKVTKVYDEEGNTPIMAAIKHLKNPKPMLDLLIDKGAKILEINDNDDPPPLRYLLNKTGCYKLFRDLLDAARDEEGFACFFFESGSFNHGGLVGDMLTRDSDLVNDLADEFCEDRELESSTRAILRAMSGQTSDIYETSSENSDSDHSSSYEYSSEENSSDSSSGGTSRIEVSDKDEDSSSQHSSEASLEINDLDSKSTSVELTHDERSRENY